MITRNKSSIFVVVLCWFLLSESPFAQDGPLGLGDPEPLYKLVMEYEKSTPAISRIQDNGSGSGALDFDGDSIADHAVITPKIVDGAVTSSKLTITSGANPSRIMECELIDLLPAAGDEESAIVPDSLRVEGFVDARGRPSPRRPKDILISWQSESCQGPAPGGAGQLGLELRRLLALRIANSSVTTEKLLTQPQSHVAGLYDFGCVALIGFANLFGDRSQEILIWRPETSTVQMITIQMDGTSGT